MEKLNKILAIYDEKHEQQTAVLRALELARLCDASIHIVATIFTVINFADNTLQIDTEALLRKNIQSRLNYDLKHFLTTLDTNGIQLTYETLWSPRPAADIAGLCANKAYDLVIKTANKHRLFDGIFHTPLDWHLLRECPCSVLLVTDKTYSKDNPIIVAVDSNSNDNAHTLLNSKLLKTGKFMAALYQNEILAVNACPPLPVMVDLEYTSFDPGLYIEDLIDIASKNTLKIISPFNLHENSIRVLEGAPEDVIPALADEIKSRLIILGTVSRTGLKGFIMGNTAEQLLHHLHCDVLAIKPDGFGTD